MNDSELRLSTSSTALRCPLYYYSSSLVTRDAGCLCPEGTTTNCWGGPVVQTFKLNGVRRHFKLTLLLCVSPSQAQAQAQAQAASGIFAGLL